MIRGRRVVASLGFGDTFTLGVKEGTTGHAFVFIGEDALMRAVASGEAFLKILGVVR